MMSSTHDEIYDLSREQFHDYDDGFNMLADRINALNDRLTASNIESLMSESRDKLDKWRSEAHQCIDRFHDDKYRELDRYAADILDKQRKEIHRIRSMIATVIHKETVLHKDFDYMKRAAHQLEQEMNDTKQKYLQLDIHPLKFNENLIQIREATNACDPSILSPPYRTINYLDDSSKVVCANERHLLIHQGSNLCLLDKELNVVKENSWTHGWIMDICWSAVLGRYLVLTRNYLFLIDESTMSIVRVQKLPRLSWWSCTCSDRHLYLTTKEWASEIHQFTFWPSIQLVKRYQSPQTCKEDETIHCLTYHKDTLALMICNRVRKSKSIELRASNTFDRLWSLALDIEYDARPIRCCLLNHDEWLVVDWNTSNLFHVSTDGQLKRKSDYHPSPSCATMFSPTMLVLSTADGINLHKI